MSSTRYQKGFATTKLAALLSVLMVAGCESHAWHQKMTVTVQTPSGEVSGSAVTAVSWSRHAIQTDGMGWDYTLTGEAVVVEVTPGHYLFALLKGAGTTEYMGSVMAASMSGQEGRVIDGPLFAQVQEKSGKAAGVVDVPENQLPVMVIFDDPADARTVHRVRPKDMEASFGPGVTLKSVTLEVTDAPVTAGIVAGLLGDLAAIGKAKPIPLTFPDGKTPVTDGPDDKYLSILDLSTEVYK